MVRFRFILSKFLVIFAVGLIFLANLTLFSRARAEQAFQNTENYCLSCHSDASLFKQLPDGESLSLFIDPEILTTSVHSPLGIECQACHTQIKEYPHPEPGFGSHREMSQAYVGACKKCHSTIYEKTQDSIHEEIARSGKSDTPICTDCHGAHDVRSPDEPRTRISETCGHCHQEILATYKSSVHGSALLQENNLDVPVCTDCHGVHNIQDPRTQQFRIKSPELCAGCHANAQLMEKYGLPSNVYDLYELSWHGLDVSVYQARWPTLWHNSAVCTDCHGIHDILASDNPESTVNPANLLVTCQKCHPKAGPNWVGAWTGHNEISPSRTPWLFYVNLFYSYLVPVVLWVSILYVFFQILHGVIDRVKRSLA